MKNQINIKNIKNELLILKNIDNKQLSIILEKNANIDIIEIISDKKSIKTKRNFILNENAKLNYIKIQNVDEKNICNFEYKNTLDTKAIANLYFFEYGSKESKNTINTMLEKEHSILDIKILVKIQNLSLIENFINTEHKTSFTLSSIMCKSILNHKSKALFFPFTKVHKNTIKTQAYQYSKALLLSDNANIKVNPHLEILSEDLTAKHGSSIGSLDKNQIFYLQSRALSYEKAVKILTQAFENEIYDNISQKDLKDFMKKYIRNNYV